MNAVKLSTPMESGFQEEPYYTHICEGCDTPLLTSELEEGSAVCCCPMWAEDEIDSAYMECFDIAYPPSLDDLYDASVLIRADMRLSDAELAKKYQVEGPIKDAKWLFFTPILALGTWLYWVDQETSFRKKQLEAIERGEDHRNELQNVLAQYIDPKNLPNVAVAINGWVAEADVFEDNGEADIVIVGGEYHNKRGKLYTEKHANGVYESYGVIDNERHNLIAHVVQCYDEMDAHRIRTDYQYLQSCVNGFFRGEIISRFRVVPLVIKTMAGMYAIQLKEAETE